MPKKERIVKHTNEELRAMQERGESKSDWGAAAILNLTPVINFRPNVTGKE